jgi:hypothetical protein
VNSGSPDDWGIAFTNERDPPPSAHETSIEVHSWRLLKAPTGELHLGTLRDPQGDRASVRLTSALASINATARVAKTGSGRTYVLVGPPESRLLERQAIRNGAAHLGLADGIDISDKIWLEMLTASLDCSPSTNQ